MNTISLTQAVALIGSFVPVYAVIAGEEQPEMILSLEYLHTFPPDTTFILDPEQHRIERNQHRSETARRTLEFFSQLAGSEDEPIEDNLTDLLTNLLHMADHEPTLSFEDCLRRANDHFAMETMGHE
jgi:hypothetical protein